MSNISNTRMRQIEAEMSRFENELLENSSRTVGAAGYASDNSNRGAFVSLPPPPAPPPMFLPPQLRARLPSGIGGGQLRLPPQSSNMPSAPLSNVPTAAPSQSATNTAMIRPRVIVQTAGAAAAAAASAASAAKNASLLAAAQAASAAEKEYEKPKLIYSAPPQLTRPRSPAAVLAQPASSTVITKTLLRSLDKVKKKRKKDEIAAAMGGGLSGEHGSDAAGVSALGSVTGGGAVSMEAAELEAAAAAHRDSAKAAAKHAQQPPKKKKFIRTAAGTTWEDTSLGEWDVDDFRLFCGNLGNEVSDEVLTRTFSKFPSFLRAKVARDRRTGKTRGYGFISFKDPSDFSRAMREMQGKYVGNRPIKLERSAWRDRQLDVVRKRDKEKRKLGGVKS